MRKTKILRIIARLNIGGPAIHTILLTEGLDKSNFETILVTGTSEKSEGDMLYLAEEKGISPLIISELGRSLNMRHDIIALWKLFCLIRKEKPDIIHTHTAKAGALGRLAALLCRFYYKLSTINYKPIVIHTFHGHVLHSYFHRIKSALFIWIERFLAIFTNEIIAVSENLRKELIGMKIANPGKIVTIPLGLELEKYLKIERNGARFKNYKSVGIVGRLVPVKNHKMFLDVAKKLIDTLKSEQKIKFLIVGDGPLRQELESYVGRLGISEVVTFTGWQKDLHEIYSEFDVVTLTSLNEGTPVALIEAQAAACPCVATNVGGVPNVVEDAKSGFLVSSRDVNKFTEALLKLLTNPELALSMGRYGRERIGNKFNKARLVKDIETIYNELLRCKK